MRRADFICTASASFRSPFWHFTCSHKPHPNITFFICTAAFFNFTARSRDALGFQRNHELRAALLRLSPVPGRSDPRDPHFRRQLSSDC